ncbi:MAG: 3-hydroxyacyl-ACP dehydratase FabZ [Cypionkella sp.]|jgi:3-hydroxyacyl-[acyl-carrier-protein] dehydratase|nr:3-hydroxyacyl-ACP dehydratase FabZ [Cypionkella sp.]
MTDTAQDTAVQSADIALIQRILPHRYPFLLVDKVVDIHINKSCVGIKCVTMNEPQFTGHFPGMPVFPGVMIIEAMAQTSGILVGLSMDLVDKNANVFFMGVDGVKFRRKVVPGDVLELHVKALRGGGRVWKFEGRAMVGDELACEAEFTAMFDVPKKA